jgi:ribose 5-phosphate isomerase RpiB
MDEARLPETVAAFLATECTEERHRRRVQKIQAIEEGYRK